MKKFLDDHDILEFDEAILTIIKIILWNDSSKADGNDHQM